MLMTQIYPMEVVSHGMELGKKFQTWICTKLLKRIPNQQSTTKTKWNDDQHLYRSR